MHGERGKLLHADRKLGIDTPPGVTDSQFLGQLGQRVTHHIHFPGGGVTPSRLVRSHGSDRVSGYQPPKPESVEGGVGVVRARDWTESNIVSSRIYLARAVFHHTAGTCLSREELLCARQRFQMEEGAASSL